MNACSFLASAWDETREEIAGLAGFKTAGEGKKLVLMGCLPIHLGDDGWKRDLPEVDFFIPPGRHGDVARIVRTLSGRGEEAPSLAPADFFSGSEDRELLTPAHTAYLKIAEGCSHQCEFCAIPLIKGPMVGREPRSIVREAAKLAEKGVREITIVAQDPAAYRHGDVGLVDLVQMISRQEIEWIRILYIHPSSMRVDELKRLYEIPSVCRYLDVPVQHASDGVLSRMNRGYDRRYLKRLFSEMKTAFPDLALRTEVIVGYPGETEDDFNILTDFVQEIQFAYLGIFAYSPERGTAAWEREDDVAMDVKRARVAELESVQQAAAFAFNSKLVGRRLTVLVDGPVDEGHGRYADCSFAGRYYGQAPEIDGEVLIRGDGLEPGSFVQVEVMEADAFDLVARVP